MTPLSSYSVDNRRSALTPCAASTMQAETSATVSGAVVPHGTPSTTPLGSGSPHLALIFVGNLSAALARASAVWASSSALTSHVPPPGQSGSVAQPRPSRSPPTQLRRRHSTVSGTEPSARLFSH